VYIYTHNIYVLFLILWFLSCFRDTYTKMLCEVKCSCSKLLPGNSWYNPWPKARLLKSLFNLLNACQDNFGHFSCNYPINEHFTLYCAHSTTSLIPFLTAVQPVKQPEIHCSTPRLNTLQKNYNEVRIVTLLPMLNQRGNWFCHRLILKHKERFLCFHSPTSKNMEKSTSTITCNHWEQQEPWQNVPISDMLSRYFISKA
jgi:hypothetical protein